MALGVYVTGEVSSVVEAMTLAIERSDDLFVAPAPAGADVVLADAGSLDSSPVPQGAALVVFATSNPIAAARVAMDRGAEGLLAWPQDERDLAVLLFEAAARRAVGGAGAGLVVAVVGARGGAGASTVVAYLARTLGKRAIILDARGGAAGQELFAAGEPGSTLAALGRVLDDITSEGVRRALGEHASGAPCLFGGLQPWGITPQLVAACRGVAPVTLVDGPAPDADLTLVVVGPDVGSLRAASSLVARGGHTEVVLDRARRRGLGSRDVARALGRPPIAVVPRDVAIARRADLGRLRRRGKAVRALRRLAEAVERESVRDRRDPVVIA